MMALLSFLLALAGFALMGLSQTDHHRWAYARAPARALARRLRVAGAIFVLLSLLPAAAAWGWAFGSFGWFGLLSLAAAILLIIRTYLPSRAARDAASTTKKQGKS
jgi:hypothetical protein